MSDTVHAGMRKAKRKGSVEWCEQTSALAHTTFFVACESVQSWQELLDEITEFCIWEKIPANKPYGSRDKWAEAEFGVSFDRLTAAYLARRAEAQQVAEEKGTMGRRGRPKNDEAGKPDNVRNSEFGNDLTYTLRRLKRDEPELFRQVCNGELSANAAAIEAGFRVKTVSIRLEPESASRTIAKHFSGDQIEQLVKLLAQRDV